MIGENLERGKTGMKTRAELSLVSLPDQSTKVPLTRAKIKGWVNWVFWGLRVYIAIMLILVIWGFVRGTL